MGSRSVSLRTLLETLRVMDRQADQHCPVFVQIMRDDDGKVEVRWMSPGTNGEVIGTVAAGLINAITDDMTEIEDGEELADVRCEGNA